LIFTFQAEIAKKKSLEEELAKVVKDQEDLKKRIAHERAISKRQYVAENGLRFLRVMARIASSQGITDVALPINMGNLGEFAIHVKPGNYAFAFFWQILNVSKETK
jgi:hypothetical protein